MADSHGRWPWSHRYTVVGHGGWTPEPVLGRMADGVPARVDRVAALGDAVVPRVAEWIGRRIMAAA